MTAKAYFQAVLAAERELKLIRAKIRHYEDIGFSITGGSLDAPVVCHSRGASRVTQSPERSGGLAERPDHETALGCARVGWKKAGTFSLF